MVIDLLLKEQLPEGSFVKKTEGVFMNESGKSVTKFLDFYKILPENLLVVHDDIDLPLGEIRVQKDRSSAGHKGVQSIIDILKTQNFTRARVGVGRSEGKEVEDWVLENFAKEEKEAKQKATEKAVKLILKWLLENRVD